MVGEVNKIYSKAVDVNKNIGPITEVILQATPFCNFRCTYCYLSEESRSTKITMNPIVAAKAIKFIIESGYANKKLVLRWHAGEPLAAGIDFYEECIDLIKNIVRKDYEVIHTIQTNASYINDNWCDFFKKHKFNVGVSIDGPDFIHNKYRVFSNGQGTHKLTSRGISFLNKHQIPFEIIAVLTIDSLKYPDEVYNYFCKIGTKFIQFNIEELEGVRNKFLMDPKIYLIEYKEFLKKIFELQKKGSLKIREIEERKNAIINGKDDVVCVMNKPFFILNVDYLGNFSTYCPELLGTKHNKYGSFILGNIYKNTIDEVLATNKFEVINSDIKAGIQKCKEECKYYFLCGGGAPGNKLSENGTFNSTETFYCKTRFQIPIDIILSEMMEEQLIVNK